MKAAGSSGGAPAPLVVCDPVSIFSWMPCNNWSTTKRPPAPAPRTHTRSGNDGLVNGRRVPACWAVIHPAQTFSQVPWWPVQVYLGSFEVPELAQKLAASDSVKFDLISGSGYGWNDQEG